MKPKTRLWAVTLLLAIPSLLPITAAPAADRPAAQAAKTAAPPAKPEASAETTKPAPKPEPPAAKVETAAPAKKRAAKA